MDKTLRLSLIATASRLYKKLKTAQRGNARKYAFFYGKQEADMLGIKKPAELQACTFALGWAATAVNVRQERTKFTGYESVSGDYTELAAELNTVYRNASFESLQYRMIIDAYVTGNAYMSIAPGDVEAGEPDVIYMPESSSLVYGEMNNRTNKLDNALKIVDAPNENVIKVQLYTKDAIYTMYQRSDTFWTIDEAQTNEHGLGRVPMTRAIINGDNVYTEGRSVITRPLRALIWQAMDVLVGASQTMHYFAYPLRVFLNTVSTMFDASDITEVGKSQRETTLRVFGEIRDAISVPYNTQNQQEVKAQQFSGNSPEGILNGLDVFAKLAAREMGVTPSYLGVESVNPVAADSINADERKLVNDVKTYIPHFRAAFREATEIGLMIGNDGELPEGWDDIEINFMRPETFTPAASADRALKIKQAGVFEQEFPRWYYEELGMENREISTTLAFVRKNRVSTVVDQVAAMLPSGVTPVEAPPVDTNRS